MPDPIFSVLDHAHMQRALVLAERGRFTTKPNPVVGCVLAHGERVVGEGWHQRAGEAHAEVHALEAAGADAKGATAYVTLEPCGKTGRTPPCADALVGAGVSRVVVACEDAHQHDGGAVERMREAGIVVEHGLLRAAAREANIGFFSRVERGRPFVRVKLATSIDGRTALANGDSKWISCEASRHDVARWRARSSAILTGSGTVRVDDPRMTVRMENDTAFEPPLRVVLDTGLAIPATSHIVDGSAPTLLVHGDDARIPAHFREHERLGLPAMNGRIDLAALMAALAERGINEVQVEAGATLSGALFDAWLADELLLYQAPTLLGDHARPLLAGIDIHDMRERVDLDLVEVRQIGNDLRLRLRPKASKA